MRSYLFSTALLCFVLAEQPAQAQSATPSPDTKSGEDIVVTGLKQDRPLFQTPGSATIVTPEQIDRQNMQSLSDIATRSPNVYFTDFTNSTPTITIRGLGFSDDESDSSGTGVLIDGVPVYGPIVGTLFDLKSTEILRGPQSVLYGQNSMGGVISLATADPGFTFGGHAEAGYGRFNAWDAKLAVDVPLGARTAVRFSGGADQGDGFIRNTTLGRDDTAGWKSRFGRAKFVHENDAGGIWRLSVQHVERDGGNDYFLPAATAFTHQSTVTDKGQNDVRNTLVTAGYTGPVGGGLKLTAIAGASWMDWDYFLPQSIFGGPTGFNMRQRQFTGEVRLSREPAPDQAIDWMVGAYVSHSDKAAPYLFEVPGAYRSYTMADITGDTGALFGELGWSFAPGWRLAGAGRVEFDRRRMNWRSEQSGVFDGDGDGIPESSYSTVDTLNGEHLRDTVFLPRLTLEYRGGERHYAWITATRGYKASGFNQYATEPAVALGYKPEFANYIEAGYRYRTADNVWDASAVFYYTWLRHQQVVVPGADGQTLVDNAGKSHSRGFELTTDLRPHRSLQLSAFFGFVDAEYDQYVNDGTNYAGVQFPNTPRWSYGFEARWSPVKGLDGDVSIRRFARSNLYPTSTVENPAYTLLDANISYTIGRYTVGIFGKNLTNADYLVRAVDPQTVVTGQPRTFGGRVGVSF